MYKNNFFRHSYLQGQKIQQRVNSRHENALPTYRDIPVHILHMSPSRVKKGFVKGEALRLLGTNSKKETFEKNIDKFKTHLMETGYPRNFIYNTLSEVKFEGRKQALLQQNNAKKRILPFVMQYHPAVLNLKEILMSKWYFIQQQPLLNEIFKDPPKISYRKISVYREEHEILSGRNFANDKIGKFCLI